MKGIFHVHSEFSNDSNLKIEDIISYAKQNKIGVISVTDHNTIKGSLELSKRVDKSIISIIGAEYSTDKGHILVLFLKQGLEDILHKNHKGQYDFHQVIKESRKQDALIYFAHPNKITKQDIELVDGIEVFNSRVLDIKRNKKAYKMACDNLKLMIGGSDAHTKWEIGNCIVDIISKENKLKCVKESLKTNNFLEIKCKTANYYHSAYTQILKQKRVKCYSSKYIFKQYIKFFVSFYFYIKKLLNRKQYNPIISFNNLSIGEGEKNVDY